MKPHPAPQVPRRAGTEGRLFNFSAGPATLPKSVLEEAAAALLEVGGTGAGILEQSHRGTWFKQVLHDAESAVRAAMGAGDEWEVIFLQGGASLHFAMLPLNFLPVGGAADYPDTDVWTSKAIREARALHAAGLAGAVHLAWDGSRTGYDRVPRAGEVTQSPGATYHHYCSNNTVRGTRYAEPPAVDAPLICDASSEILSRPIDLSRHAVVYATAQKNLGLPGTVLMLLRKEFLGRARKGLPPMLSYQAFAAEHSMPNTPSTMGIWLVERMVRWAIAQGGQVALARSAEERATMLYGEIDRSGGFYRGIAQPWCRSHMNVSFRLPTPELDRAFVAGAAREGMVGLEGHREAGGIRASIYNAMPREGCAALASFMREFSRTQG